MIKARRDAQQEIILKADSVDQVVQLFKDDPS